ncbi:MAG: FkbM family methyltransferase [Salinivirgaceae bacterium]|nr:FkbM family methyltransferase [Salinivirgaceae bacterium]
MVIKTKFFVIKWFAKCIAKTIQLLIKLGCPILANKIYNKSRWEVKRSFLEILKPFKKEICWEIELLNTKTISAYICKDSTGWNNILTYYTYAPELCILENIISNYLSNKSIYVDIGANYGVRSLLMLSEGIKTYMFEANPYLIKELEERCFVNKFKNYKIESLAVSCNQSSSTFYISNRNSMSSLELEFAETKGVKETIIIETVSLDYYFDELLKNKNEGLHFIKIDVEGHELKVIEGAKRIIHEIKPVFLIEIANLVDKLKIINLFLDCGYSIYCIQWGFKKILCELTNNQKIIEQSLDFLFIPNVQSTKKLITQFKKELLMIE